MRSPIDHTYVHADTVVHRTAKFVTMRVKFGLRAPAAQAEGERRLRYWAGDPDAPTWRAQ